jgi:hypothetical protein
VTPRDDTTGPAPDDSRLPAAAGRWLLLGTALVQAASPIVLPFGGSGDDPPVVPAGYAFTIWGVIVLGCLAAAAYGFPARRAGSALFRAAQVPLSIVQLLFVAWLLAARGTAVWLTVPIFAAMLVLLVTVLLRIRDLDTPTGRTGRILLGVAVGLYAGWTSAAVWVNTATVLAAAGLTTAGTAGLAWQALALTGATATVSVVGRALTRRMHGPAADAPMVAYLAAGAWALVGVAVGATGSSQPALALVAAGGLAAVAVAVAFRLRAATA